MATESAGSSQNAAAADPPLDEVMLAMDVVDTLRHQDALVQAELSEGARSEALIARIKAIYASQGMEVPDAVIAEGVEALRKDRFTYRPPERTWPVRLAEIYVERGKWAKRCLVVLLLIGIVWGAIAIPRAMRRRAQREAFRAGVSAVLASMDKEDARLRDALARADRLEESLQRDPPWKPLVERARASLAQARDRLHDLRTRPALDRAGDSDRDALERDLAAQKGLLASASTLLFDGERALHEAEDTRQRREEAIIAEREANATRDRDLQSLRAMLVRFEPAQKDPALDADAARDVQASFAKARQAVTTENVLGARAALSELSGLLQEVNATYELRIVTRGQSGVWRRWKGRPGAKRYYILVEAVDATGAPVALPILNEESNQTHRKSTFGVHVAERIYEAVKKDKQDDGIVDRIRFGSKARGTRKIHYEFEVLGGMITEW